SSERQRLRYLDAQRIKLSAALSILLEHPEKSGDLARQVYDIVLSRKGITGEVLYFQRMAELTGKYQQFRREFQELRELQSELAASVLAGPAGRSFDAYRTRMARLQVQKD